MELNDLFRKNIRDLAPYSTARDEYRGDIGVYLDANESPYENGCNRYPDPHQRLLKQRIAEIKGVPVERIFIGNGSDEAIDGVYRVFCEPRVHNAVSIAPSYGMYRVAADINDVEFRPVPLEPGFRLDARKLLDATDENTRLVFLCSPNNPSGSLLDAEEVRTVLREFPGIVAVDEAYIDFAGTESLVRSLDEYPNLVVFQTFSKAWGMAGLRVGLAFAHPEIVDRMSRVKYPYNINGPTQTLLLERLADTSAVEAQVRELVAERDKLRAALRELDAVREVWPGDANFLLVRVDDPRKTYDRLIAERVIVRDRSRIAGCEGCLRITVGTPDENRRVIEILKNEA